MKTLNNERRQKNLYSLSLSTCNTFQGEVEARHPLILKLGLIQGTLSGDEASTKEQPKWLTYAHKLFHDCLAGYHISRKVCTCCIRYLNFQFSI